MSWNKKEFNSKYNRSKEPSGKQAKDISEADSHWLESELEKEYARHPTMEEIRTGYLVKLLHKLGLKYAGHFLHSWWW